MLLTAVENFTAVENLNLWNWNYAFDKRDSSFRRPGYASLCGAVNQAFASVRSFRPPAQVRPRL